MACDNYDVGFMVPSLASLRVGKPHHKRKKARAAPATLEEDSPIHIAFRPIISVSKIAVGNPTANSPKSNVYNPTPGLPAPAKPV